MNMCDCTHVCLYLLFSMYLSMYVDRCRSIDAMFSMHCLRWTDNENVEEKRDRVRFQCDTTQTCAEIQTSVVCVWTCTFRRIMFFESKLHKLTMLLDMWVQISVETDVLYRYLWVSQKINLRSLDQCDRRWHSRERTVKNSEVRLPAYHRTSPTLLVK